MTPKKMMRFASCMFSLLLVFVMFFNILPGSVFATEYVGEEHLEITGTYVGRFELTTNKSELFNLKNIIPGDSWTGKIFVKNSGEENMEFALLDIVSDLEDTVLFDSLYLKITSNNTVLYSGEYGGFPSRSEDGIPPQMMAYQVIKPGNTFEMDVFVKLPEAVGNEAMGKEMDSTWIFESRYMSPYGPTYHDYDVHYVDKNGKHLLPSKIGNAALGMTVIEQAAKIEGYTPDAEEKRLVIEGDGQEIIFVYTNGNAPAQTGVDTLTASTTSAVIWVAILTIILAAMIMLRIKIEKRKMNK